MTPFRATPELQDSEMWGLIACSRIFQATISIQVLHNKSGKQLGHTTLNAARHRPGLEARLLARAFFQQQQKTGKPRQLGLR